MGPATVSRSSTQPLQKEFQNVNAGHYSRAVLLYSRKVLALKDPRGPITSPCPCPRTTSLRPCSRILSP